MALRAVVTSGVWSRCPATYFAATLLLACYSTGARSQIVSSNDAGSDQSRPSLAGLMSFFSTAPATQPEASDSATDENGSWHEKTAVDVEPSAENWNGFEGYPRVASLYSGATWSPLGNLRQDGPRLRVVIGGSDYRYGGQRYNVDLDQSTAQQFYGRAKFIDALAGWQVSQGATTVKIFGGWQWADHRITPVDPVTNVQGIARGAKGAIEIWHNWTPQFWTSLDLSAAQVHRTFGAQLRTGWRVDEGLSLGPEAGIVGHTETTVQHAGLFLRYENLANEITVTGGISRARGDSSQTGYATAQYLRRF